MPREERQSAITKLVQSIPVSRDKLFAVPIKWDYLNDAVLSKLDAFSRKKLKEYIVEADDGEISTIIKYVLRLVRARTHPDDMLKELGEALEAQEAETFMVKLVRMIVYETEARYQNLAG